MKIMFSEHEGMKLEINNSREFEKFTNMWKLNNAFQITNGSKRQSQRKSKVGIRTTWPLRAPGTRVYPEHSLQNTIPGRNNPQESPLVGVKEQRPWWSELQPPLPQFKTWVWQGRFFSFWSWGFQGRTPILGPDTPIKCHLFTPVNQPIRGWLPPSLLMTLTNPIMEMVWQLQIPQALPTV